MTLNLETDIIDTDYDPIKRVHTYTVEVRGRRYTASVPDAALATLTGPRGRQAKRERVAQAIRAAMAGEPDAE